MNLLAILVIAVVSHSCSGLYLDKQECKIDVVAVIDGSETIFPDEFQTIRDVMSQFIQDIGVGENNKHFGAVIYSTDVSEVIEMSGDQEKLVAAMQNMHHPRTGTRTDLGIEEMINVLRRNWRDGVPKVGIVITDGVSHEKDLTLLQAQNAKDMGVNMFAIGIGNLIMNDELVGIASNPAQAFVIEDFEAFAKLIAGLSICPTTTTSTTTTTTTTTTTPKPTTPEPTTPEPTTPKPTTPEPTTPEPTTPEPTTPVPTTQEPTNPPTGPCSGCRMRNGIGYNSHQECHKFVQCFFRDDGLVASYHVQTCGGGTFWNQDKLTCDHMSQVNCLNDRCKLYKGLKSYKLGGSCSEYVECVNGRSQPSKCRVGYSFIEADELCLKDASCTTGGSVAGDNECNFWAIPGTKCYYYWTSGSQGWTMPCPRGTRFAPRQCGCVYATPNRCRARACEPLVDIDFNQPEPGEYDNYGAVVEGGLAYFDGQSNIKILRLANVEFTTKLSILVRYKPLNTNVTRDRSEAVVSNGDCGQEATINILNNGEVATLSVIDAKDHQSTLRDMTQLEWREAEYTFEKGEMKSLMNGKSGLQISELPKRSQCAFQLGHSEGFEDFKGWIDYIVVSTC